MQGNVLPGLHHLTLFIHKSHPEVEYDVQDEEHFDEDVRGDGGLEVGGVTKCGHPEQRRRWAWAMKIYPDVLKAALKGTMRATYKIATRITTSQTLNSDLAYREQGIRNGKEFWSGVGWV